MSTTVPCFIRAKFTSVSICVKNWDEQDATIHQQGERIVVSMGKMNLKRPEIGLSSLQTGLYGL
jgi:hypothetical protein